MKAKFTLLVVLFLLTTSIYALEPAHNKSRKLTGGFLKNRLERTEKSTEHDPFQRKMGFQKQANSLKSAQAVKQRLDSIVEFYDNVSDYKFYFTYDSKGNNTQELDYEWDSNTNTWVVSYNDAYTYDASGNITQERGYVWDINTNAWVNYWKGDYTYDAKGNQTQYSYLYWDKSTNTWTGNKYDYTYDANGNITQEIGNDWDGITNAWIAGHKLKYDYNYDIVGNNTQKFSYYWDSNTNTWLDEYKTDYSYDSQGNNTQKVAYSWDGFNTNTWVGYYKNDYTYDAKGHMTQNSRYNWDGNTNAWVYRDNESTSNYTYDANGNLTSEIRYDLDKTTSQLILSYKFVISYNLSYTLSDLIISGDWIDDVMMNMPLEELYYFWDKTSNSWIDDEKYVYYYTEINFTSVPKTVASGIDIYPNPVSDYIKVSGVSGVATFNLYNLQGKLILNKTLTGDEPVNVSGLSKGAYIYNLNVDGKMQSGKLVKE